MCGIVGYIGSQNAAPILIEGLSRLEYRGYDSAGIAIVSPRGTQVFRRVGRVRELETSLPRRLPGKTGIGHTRWATHGPVTQANAHPQVSEDGRISVVHNGIIDNATELRDELTGKGEIFSSDTDTEVVAHLIARSGAETLEDAVLDALGQITGTYAFAVTDDGHPDRIVVARNGSPLILGVGDREMFIASDLSALVRHTTSVVHLDDSELATVTAAGFAPSAARRRTPPRSRSASTWPTRMSTWASTGTSCARRSSSSPPRSSGCCAGGWTSGSARPGWTG